MDGRPAVAALHCDEDSDFLGPAGPPKLILPEKWYNVRIKSQTLESHFKFLPI